MTFNPFDWTAEPFLLLYVVLAGSVIALGFGLRMRIGPTAGAIRQLTVFELAYLGGGAKRLGDAVLLGLTSGKGAAIDAKGRKITVYDQTPLTSLVGTPMTLSVRPDMSRDQFQTALKPLVDRIVGRLQDFGYCPSDDQMASFRMTILPFIGAVLVFGLIKVTVGSARHHPVGILVFCLMATALAGFLLAKRPTRTRAGDEVLQTYKTAQARAARAPLEHELLLAVALSGAVVLSGTAFAPVYAASRTMSSGSGDSGGGCGGGGGGCGGCS